MARDDGKKYGGGGKLIEIVEPQSQPEPKPKKKTKKQAEILEERIIDTLPSDVEPGEEE